jgi:23S rRNA (cytosine1962-C5)-methyltransferase
VGEPPRWRRGSAAPAGPRPRATIDRAWLGAKIARRRWRCGRIYPDAPFYRLVHAEGDGLPGLIVDRFGDTLVIQPNAIWLEDRLDDRGRAGGGDGLRHASSRTAPRAPAGRGPAEEMAVLLGDRARGAARRADDRGDLQGRCDGRAEDRPVLRSAPQPRLRGRLGAGARACSTCFPMSAGFALACLAQGAASALAVDASDAALALARAGAEASGVAGG